MGNRLPRWTWWALGVKEQRRQFLTSASGVLAGGLLGPLSFIAGARPARAQAADPNAAVSARLRAGGVVIAFRHALAPGTFDPPEFMLQDCSTQRNLDSQGREQATRIGQWFSSQALQPAMVRSSPWCRCLDTARIAFGEGAVQPWAALGSPQGTSQQAYSEHQALLRQALAQRRVTGGFEVWVTHMFVLQDLTGQAVGSAEALVLRGDPRSPRDRRAVQTVERWRPI